MRRPRRVTEDSRPELCLYLGSGGEGDPDPRGGFGTGMGQRDGKR